MRALLVLAVLACLLTLPLSLSFAAKVGETCDGIAGIKCEESSWCEYPAGECNVADGVGICVKDSPEACTQEHIPVCACGGKEFPNDCERKKAKQLGLRRRLQEVAPQRVTETSFFARPAI